MAIIQQPDNLCFSGNLKDFIISGFNEISFILKSGDLVLINEVYTADNNRIEIPVRDVIEQQLSVALPGTDDDVFIQNNAYKSFEAHIGSTVVNFIAVKGGIGDIAETSAVFMRTQWLTLQPQQKHICFHQPEWLSYYAGQACRVKVKAYYLYGRIEEKYIADLEADKLYTLDVSYSKIREKFVEQILYYDIWIEDSDRRRLTYIQRYILSSSKDKAQVYVFENTLGGIDSVVFEGNFTEKLTTTGVVATLHEISADSDIDFSVICEQNTGYLLSLEYARWLRGFFLSKQRYHVTDSFREIYIEESENSFSVIDLNSYTFEFRYSKQTKYDNVIRNNEILPELLEFPTEDELFFLAPRLAEFPIASIADDLFLPAQFPFEDKWRRISVAAIVQAAISASVDAAQGSIDLTQYWKKTELVRDELYLKFLDQKISAGFADKADDSAKWNGKLMPQWLDQPVRTTDDVRFNKVTAKELIEQVENLFPVSRSAVLSGDAVCDLLTEEGSEVAATTLGELTNVDATADITGEEDVVLFRAKNSGMWSLLPVSSIGGGGGSEIQRNIRLVNNLDSKNISASKGERCLLNFTFVSQERYSFSEPYEDTGERGLLQVSARSAENSEYVVVKQMYINSGVPFSLDVAEYLASGANNIMLKVTGEVTEATTPAFVYTVTLTSLSISADNFKWWTAYTGNVTLPLNIGGNISKILHVSVTGKDYNKSYEVQLGTSIYIETAYNYAVEHPGVTGVYEISAYVSSVDGIIRTRLVSFQVMCVVAGEKIKLVAVNNVLAKATNWTENALFDYAMYNGDEVTTAAQFVVKKEGMPVFTSNEDSITTSVRHTFNFPMEIETIDASEFEITAHVMDGETALVDALTFAVNNSSGYSAMPGAVFYLNPRTRSNRQENRLMAVNEMDQSEVACDWKGMNWGNDGWTTDAEGNKVLRLMVGSQVAIAYKPFAKEAARTGKTIEVDYKIENVTDYSRPVLTISGGENAPGLNIYADEVVMYTQSLKNRDNQGTMVHEGKRIRLALAILPAAYGNPDFNLCILYVNGVKNREFTYEDNDYFVHNGLIVIGSDYADVDVYGIRVYDAALTSEGILRNYINWLGDNHTKKEMEADNDVMDVNGSEIDFENTKDQFNVFVFDNTFPSLANPNKMKGTLEVFFPDHPEWNVSVSNVEAKGQGTSSMRYWKWNVRFTLDKKLSVVTGADGSTTTGGWSLTPALAKATKITAKKNFASSMHSHKIGSVNSVDDLYRAMGYLNEAMQTEKYKNARVAVYQLPFVAFEKSINEEGKTVYTFMGLYTMGPDKGDKNTFGYDTDLFPGLISIEGSDNSPLCALFRVPWSSRMAYNEEEEAFQYNGANSWDFDGGDTANITKWIPAYNVAYVCSNRLKPFNGTLEELNIQVASYRNEPYEFWIAKTGDANQYNVYYYEASEGRFVVSDTGEGAINLVSQLVDKGYGLTTADLSGKSADELNALFIAARIQKFRKEAPAYWDIDDAILHRNWVEFHAGTDNRAKNTYPYCFGNEGSHWKWRYDDLDTIFDTDNQGQAKKGYFVEFHDTYSTGGSVWNGETSNFWNLLDLAFEDEIWAGMRQMMTRMEELGGLKSGTDFDKLYAYFRKYYFSEAQEYFPQNLYNADVKFAYENAKLAYMDGRYTNDTDPMTQALGDHYSAEQRWITKRILYMMSKYSFGIFSASGTDNITVRAAGNTIRYELTPAMDLYPAIANGTSIIRGPRTKAGEVCEMLIELSGSGDQQNTIQGASYLEDIGDWYDKNVTGTMIVQGRMLREIRLGHKTAPIVISISALTISNCVSLQKLLLSRIATLSGTLNLTACTHLKEVSIDGTGITQLRLPEGGGLEKVEFNVLSQYLILRNYPLLTNEGVIIDECRTSITDFLIVDCPLTKPMQLLVSIMNAQADQGVNHALKRIRAAGFEETYDSSEMLDKLAELANGSYSGLNNEGLAGEDEYPVLDGTLNIHANAYEDAVEALKEKFRRLVLNITGEFYVRFKDQIVANYFIRNYGDGVGVTKNDLAAINSLSDTAFQGNTEITSFDEFRYLTGIVSIPGKCFQNCGSLRSVIIPVNVQIISIYAFRYSGLESINIPKNVNNISSSTFEGSKLKSVIFEERTEKIQLGSGIFMSCTELTDVIFPDLVFYEAGGASNIFKGCTSLISVHLPESSDVTFIEAGMFQSCTSLADFNIGPYIVIIKSRAFNNCPLIKRIDLSKTNVVELGDNAFDTTGLSEIVFNNKINRIGMSCFANCQFKTFQFPDAITVISRSVLQSNKKLQHIILPAGVTEINYNAFASCSALVDIVSNPIVPPTLDPNVFNYGNNTFKVYVPDESINAYKTATNWSTLSDRIYPLSQKPE